MARIIPASIKLFLEQETAHKDIYKFQNKSYSQEGEDLVLSRFLQDRQKGIYVDIGAHHPMRFSNTYHFYLRGWRGVNIDAMPGSMRIFNEYRPKDINLEIPVYDTNQTLTYYVFSDLAFNTFSKVVATDHIMVNKATLLHEEKLQTQRLEEILNNHLPKGVKIDFMTIDIEGLELPALKSNNWEKYKPEYLLIEKFIDSMVELQHLEVHQFLTDLSYILIAKTYNTLIYKKALL